MVGKGLSRGRFDLRLLFALLLMIATTATAAAERRVALVMAEDDYRLVRPLANPVHDGEAMEAALKKLGFEVVLETNRDLRRMRRALDDFREDAKGADVALVYFSGHGVEISGDNRLLPVDADASSLDQLDKTSLPLEEVRDAVAATAKVGLIVLDACRSDPFSGARRDVTGKGCRRQGQAGPRPRRPGGKHPVCLFGRTRRDRRRRHRPELAVHNGADQISRHGRARNPLSADLGAAGGL
jgi:hypothetical protein